MKRLMFLLALMACKPIAEVEPIKIEVTESYKELSEWEILEMAIMMTESRFNSEAEGRTNDKGVFQITPVFVAEANRLSGRGYVHEDAYSIEKSLEMFDIIQRRYNPDHSVEKAIKLHNPGGDSIGYEAKVRQNMDLIRRMEAARKALVER